MWWKTAKDYLIESLQSELARERQERAEIQAKYDALVAKLQERAKVDVTHQKQTPSRTLRAFCDDLSRRSYQRAAAGKNLVAQLPPPGAVGPDAGA